MKKGDKIICIKDAIFFENQLYFKNGEIYEIENISIHNYGYDRHLSYVSVKRNLDDSAAAFWLYEQIEEWYKFSDYFMSIAEWRDKQINSILENE